MFKVTIKTDNAAFEDKAAEVARILREIADRVEGGSTHGRVPDINGNFVAAYLTC